MRAAKIIRRHLVAARSTEQAFDRQTVRQARVKGRTVGACVPPQQLSHPRVRGFLQPTDPGAKVAVRVESSRSLALCSSVPAVA